MRAFIEKIESWHGNVPDGTYETNYDDPPKVGERFVCDRFTTTEVKGLRVEGPMSVSFRTKNSTYRLRDCELHDYDWWRQEES